MEQEIQTVLHDIASEYGATLAAGKITQSKDFDYLSFSQIALISGDKTVHVNIVHNRSSEPAQSYVDSVEYKNCTYSERAPEEYLQIIRGIFEELVIVKKTFWKKKDKLIITNKEGKPLFYPRIVL